MTRKYPDLAPHLQRENIAGVMVRFSGLSRGELLQKYGEPRPVPGIEGGSITLLDFMGGDQAIVQSARTSYRRGVSEHKWVADGAVARCSIEAGIVSKPWAVWFTHLDGCDTCRLAFAPAQRHAYDLKLCDVGSFLRRAAQTTKRTKRPRR